VFADIVRQPAATIDDVVDAMMQIDRALPETDGVRWFNHLYLRVTEAVLAAIQDARPFHDPAFLRRLDVVFANLYFEAMCAADRGVDRAPPAWRPLLRARSAGDVHPVQFALAGMDAHINRDLPAGIVSAYEELGGSPTVRDGRYEDFVRVNDLLQGVEADVKGEFATGKIGVADALTTPVDDRVAMWNVRAAREAAWTNAAVLWTLKPTPALAGDYFAKLDRMTGFTACGLLAPIVNHPTQT
jgi:hypothetical protein